MTRAFFVNHNLWADRKSIPCRRCRPGMTTGQKPPVGFSGVMVAYGQHGDGRTAYACVTCGLES